MSVYLGNKRICGEVQPFVFGTGITDFKQIYDETNGIMIGSMVLNGQRVNLYAPNQNFDASKLNIANAIVTVDQTEFTYASNDSITPKPRLDFEVRYESDIPSKDVILVENVDYVVNYYGNDKELSKTCSNTAYCVITGIGNYTGSKTIEFTISYSKTDVKTWECVVNSNFPINIQYMPKNVVWFNTISDDEVFQLPRSTCYNDVDGFDSISSLYIFDGWNNLPNGLGRDYGFGDVITVKEDMMFFAKWTPREFAIEYYDGGQRLNLVPNAYTYGDDVVNKLPSVLDNDKEFIGWSEISNISEYIENWLTCELTASDEYSVTDLLVNRYTFNGTAKILYTVYENDVSAYFAG